MPCIFDIKPEDRHCQYCTAIIYDPNGANPKMTIKYRRYKGEKLNESV